MTAYSQQEKRLKFAGRTAPPDHFFGALRAYSYLRASIGSMWAAFLAG